MGNEIRKAFSAIKANNARSGNIICPRCGGVLYYRIDDLNNCTGSCSAFYCLQFNEKLPMQYTCAGNVWLV